VSSARLPTHSITNAGCRNGEEWPRAYIQLKDEAKGKVTEKDIHEFMKEKVARHKQPVGGIAFIDEVPKLPSGKIIRKLLKEWAKRDASGIEGLRTSKL
jgi:acyl-CoA synthetase (AMP-forming)/AMP-acid ligase II